MSHSPLYKKYIEGNWQWRKVREQYLRSKNYSCERCLQHSPPLYRAAVCVHHIKPLDTISEEGHFKSMAYNTGNLMALCKRCHIEVHEELGKGTAEQLRKRVKEDAENFKARFCDFS